MTLEPPDMIRNYEEVEFVPCAVILEVGISVLGSQHAWQDFNGQKTALIRPTPEPPQYSQ